MKINRCKSLFGSFKQVLKNIKNCLNNLHKLVIPKGLYWESQPCSGFTLLEVIVAIIIIGALLAFALPKYETALDKSRFSTLMPITKSIKDAEEVFYIASNQYTEDVSSLDVKVNPGETVQVSVKDDDDYSYVQAIDPRIENIYKAYLKHSTNFPEERHCEALTDSTRAKKVCETLGGTLLDESGEYTVYVLEGTGQGSVNTEKQCEGAEPDTTQTCASGCGTQTRSVSCDTSTGEWELGDWTGTCPEQGETTQPCTQGVGTETRTFNCEGNTWVAGEWDKSSCTCDPSNKPKETQACTSGSKRRTVTCEGSTWLAGEWDSDCTCESYTCADYWNKNDLTLDEQTCYAGSYYRCESSVFENASACVGENLFTCQYGTFSNSSCIAKGGENGDKYGICKDGTFTNSSCIAHAYTSCDSNKFISSTCIDHVGESCFASTFTNSSCIAEGNGCYQSKFYENSRCYANVEDGCRNNTYDDTSCCVGTYCERGTSCSEKGLPDNP